MSGALDLSPGVPAARRPGPSLGGDPLLAGLVEAHGWRSAILLLVGLLSIAGLVVALLASLVVVAVIFFAVASYLLGGSTEAKHDRPDLKTHH